MERVRSPQFATGAVVLLLSMSIGAGYVIAQEPPIREHIALPPTRGATVLSTYIDAQAHYIAAMGDYLESAAIARRHHAAATEHELRNAVNWVETYFERRALNRAYRLKEDPPYLDKVEKREIVQRRRIAEMPAEVLKGGVTDELNWLLDRLATASLAYQAIFGTDDQYVDSAIDQRLSPSDIGHIVLTDGGVQYGQKLTFRANDARVLSPRWPIVFRAPEFRAARENFEKVMANGLKEIHGQGAITYETWTSMQDAVDGLAVQLNRKYPREYRRTAPVRECLTYHQGVQFLQSQALAVHRAMATNRMETFDGTNQFVEDSVFELVRHMCRCGLQFAEPEPGDEPTYKKLLIAMREIYLHFYP